MTKPKTSAIPPLNLRAAFVPSTWNPSTGELELDFASSARTLELDGWGDPFLEELDLSPESVRLERLNSGAPVLDSHGKVTHRAGGSGLDDQIGVVVNASTDGTRARARIRLADVDSTKEVREKIDQGIIQGVSVGYRVNRYRDITTAEDETRVLLAVDWEPYEITLTPIPADFSVGLRSKNTETRNECSIEEPQPMKTPTPAEGDQKTAIQAERTRCLDIRGAAKKAGDRVTSDQVEAWISDGTPVDQVRSFIVDNLTAPKAPTAADSSSTELASERTRSLEISRIGREHDLAGDFVEKHIADGTSLDSYRALVIDRLAAADDSGPETRTQSSGITVGEESATKRIRAMQNVLHFRGQVREENASGVLVPITLDEEARNLRGMSLLDMARECLEIRGEKLRGMGKMDLVQRALMHTAGDFPNLLANTAGKGLRQAYEAVPRSWMPLATRSDATDFKAMTRHQLGDAPALLKVPDSGEIENGSLGEAAESYAVETYARTVALSRKTIVNDDLGAFTRLASAFGRAAADRENAVVWGLITGNVVMGDGAALFSAGHSNTGTGAISVANLNSGQAAMRKQKGVDNEEGEAQFINATPRFIMAPAALEATVDQFIASTVVPSVAGNVNPFAGQLQKIIEPRLDEDSAAQWYLSSSPSQVEVIEYAYLDGVDGPVFEQQEGFQIDGMRFKARLDFGAVVLDHRGLYRSSGV